MAYTPYNSNEPGGSLSPTTYATNNINNMRALRDMCITGMIAGFIMTRSTGTGPGVDRPEFIYWMNSSLSVGFRMKSTWGGTGNYQQTSIEWAWTSAADFNASGPSATWNGGTNSGILNTAQANTWDGNDNITLTSNSGGVFTLFMELWTKFLRHINSTGVHGLASMAFQAANAVNITAGNIAGVNLTGAVINSSPIGVSSRAIGDFLRIAESVQTYSPALNAGVVVDWSYGGSFINHNGVNAITFSNVPVGCAGHRLYVSNLNQVTWPGSVSFGLGGVPSSSGVCGITLDTFNSGTNIQAGLSWRSS